MDIEAIVSNVQDFDMAEMLIESGANVNTADNYGTTPLLVTCFYMTAPLVDFLVKRGANVNQADKNGWVSLKRSKLTLNRLHYMLQLSLDPLLSLCYYLEEQT
jgi:ankyrin repeat protein